ncbi:unnamed protein product [Leptidea sinapis]|uniref:Uncharacterized protein n=1 Tax=Leptidea sinapis TaxID=189913 RepID=A0A5E4QHJ2_9NEOP|nr:unnamed protein product [Leptidea sinapis]
MATTYLKTQWTDDLVKIAEIRWMRAAQDRSSWRSLGEAFNTSLKASPSIGILGLEISSNCQFRGHLEGKAKLASKKLGVINRARQYFKPAHILALYKAQIRPHMEYCCHLWSGAPQYQLDPFDRVQRRAARIVGDPVLCERLDHLALRRDVASLCVFYRIYHGECSEELSNLIPAAEFHLRTTRHKLRYHPHHLDVWPSFLVRCFRDDTTWVPSRKARTPSLKAGNALVIPLMLQESVGGGDHLTPGDPYARLYYKLITPTTRLSRVCESFIPENVQNKSITLFKRIVKKRLCGKCDTADWEWILQ